MTRGTTSVYRLRGLIGYSHLKHGDISAARYRAHPAPPTTHKELRGAAQDGNSDAVSPLSCTNRQLSAEDGTVSYWGPSLPCSDVGDTLSLKSVNVNRKIAQRETEFSRFGCTIVLCV